MTNLARKEMCVLMRNGIELWLDSDKATTFGNDLTEGMRTVVKIEGRYLNTVDIVGIFTPQDLDDYKRIKNGQWKCTKGTWHAKGEDCKCKWQQPSVWEAPEVGRDTGAGLEQLRETVSRIKGNNGHSET